MAPPSRGLCHPGAAVHDRAPAPPEQRLNRKLSPEGRDVLVPAVPAIPAKGLESIIARIYLIQARLPKTSRRLAVQNRSATTDGSAFSNDTSPDEENWEADSRQLRQRSQVVLEQHELNKFEMLTLIDETIAASIDERL